MAAEVPEGLELEDAGVDWRRAIDRVVARGRRVEVCQDGEAVAVILTVQDLESLEATLEILRDPRAMVDLAEARAEADRGEGLDAVQVRERYHVPNQAIV